MAQRDLLWEERCLARLRADADSCLEALLQETGRDQEQDRASGGFREKQRSLPSKGGVHYTRQSSGLEVPTIVITPATLEKHPAGRPSTHTTPAPVDEQCPAVVTSKRSGLSRLTTWRKSRRHREKHGSAEDDRNESSSSLSLSGRFRSVRAPGSRGAGDIRPEESAGRLRAYTESKAGSGGGVGRRDSAATLTAEFQRYVAERLTELRQQRRRGLSDDQVRDQFMREVGVMLRQIADQLREQRLQQEELDGADAAPLPARVASSAVRRLSSGLQTAAGAIQNALRLFARSGAGGNGTAEPATAVQHPTPDQEPAEDHHPQRTTDRAAESGGLEHRSQHTHRHSGVAHSRPGARQVSAHRTIHHGNHSQEHEWRGSTSWSHLDSEYHPGSEHYHTKTHLRDSRRRRTNQHHSGGECPASSGNHSSRRAFGANGRHHTVIGRDC